jgi:post-segregation antitoxin (ccd killing protein)
MAAPLNIRDIGPDRKAAIEAEAAAAGTTISDIVRDWIDAGIERARAEREHAAWIAAAKQGLAEEARHLELNGPSLARFRQF